MLPSRYGTKPLCFIPFQYGDGEILAPSLPHWAVPAPRAGEHPGVVPPALQAAAPPFQLLLLSQKLLKRQN